jgi:hypothetical protein
MAGSLSAGNDAQFWVGVVAGEIRIAHNVAQAR